jgi:hypothetical protein
MTILPRAAPRRNSSSGLSCWPTAALSRGVCAGRPERAAAVRREASELAALVATRGEFLRKLTRLTARHGFALQESAGAWYVVTFYAWDTDPSERELEP